MHILSIDTSADETSAAVTSGRIVLSSVVSSQIKSHAKWGGIVPSIAKLAHIQRIDRVCDLAIEKSGLEDGYKSLSAVAVTIGPGLSMALEVGINKAIRIAEELKIPIYGVNHMEGHLYSAFVQNSKGKPNVELEFPFLGLLISGGNTMIVEVKNNGQYAILGETQDDASGEALDKAAKMLGLGYPGGEVIEKLAKEVEFTDKYRFPRPMIYDETLNMSFSGLKTHFYYLLRGNKNVVVDLKTDLKYLASSFQEAVFDVLVKKLEKAIAKTNVKVVAVGGGVSVNKYLRTKVRALCKLNNAKVHFPPYKYLCGDNAAMIGVAASMMIQRGVRPSAPEALQRVPRLSLS